MKVELWAEIRRLSQVEKLSRREIARRLHCCTRTIKKALALDHPSNETTRPVKDSILDPHKPKIDALIAKYPRLSAVRVLEEIRKGPHGYSGQVTVVRDYLRQIRPARGRVYQEVHYDPGQAMQVDWGHCGSIRIGNTSRSVSVFVAVLCYSRLCYIEFCLSQHKAEFYRSLVHALEFYGGSPRQIIFDNLKAAVLNGSGRRACLHPEFLALCGHFCLEPIACARRDPESKGVVEAKVRYVKRNALQGRDEELTCWEDYSRLATYWRDEVANVRIHRATGEHPVDRFGQERATLRPLSAVRFDTDETVSVVVNSHARVKFDSNRYSVPPKLVRKTALLRADASQVRIIYQGQEIACHARCYERGQLIRKSEHQLDALKMRRRERANHIEKAFNALGEEARQFHLQIRCRPVKTTVHLRRLLNLVRLYGRQDVVAALTRANEYQTYDAAYVETILLQERRRRELPSPTKLRPQREELIEDIDFEEPDPATYDRFCEDDQEEE
ncbi:MAG: IS21 family transposase [Planctomycetota bacterium]|nr:IS21 family transposase [Planctomycetota bacterium]